MNHSWLTAGTVITLTALLSACASTPDHYPALDESRAAYDTAVENPDVARNGLAHLRDADKALDQADTLLRGSGDMAAIDHQVYLANRHMDIARENALRAGLQEELAAAERQRDDLRIRIGERRAQVAEMEARMLREQMQRLHAEHTERGMVMTLGDVLFDIDKAELKSTGKQTVSKLSDFMQEFGNYRVRVEGYTDSIGEAAYNQALSLRRAESVQAELLAAGIAPGRIEVEGLGEQYPKASNQSSAGRRENRRVEIVISDRDGTIGSR